MSDVKRIQLLLGRLSHACERLEVLPRGRTELLAADEPGLELALVWLELLDGARQGGDLRPFVTAVTEALEAEAIVALSRTTAGVSVIVGDLERAVGKDAASERAQAMLQDLCGRRFTTNFDTGRITAVVPESDVIAFLSVPLLVVEKADGLLLATRRRHSSTRRPFNERERLALAIAGAALKLFLH